MKLHPSDYAAVASAVSAFAASVAAWYSRRNVESTHRPLLYGEPELPDEDTGGQRLMAVRLRNEGLGVAQDVRLRFEEVGSRWKRKKWTSTTVQGPPAMRPGEICPPDSVKGGYTPNAIPLTVTGYACVVRYRDSFGRLWHSRNQRTPPGRMVARRVRWRKRAW